MKNFKLLIILSVISLTVFSFINHDVIKNPLFNKSKTNDKELDGKTFTGTATEITPPDIDRMPKVYNETISFQDNKLICESFKNYIDSNTDVFYESAIDDRRLIAYTVVNFNSSAEGYINGEKVNLELNGSVIAYKNLSGTLIIRYPDKNEIKFFIEAVIN